MFNTLQFAKKLEEVGISRDQAEAHVQIIAEIIEGDMATKQDIKGLEVALKQDFQTTDLSLRRDMEVWGTSLRQDIDTLNHVFKTLEINLRQEMRQLEYRMVIKLGSIVTIVTTLAMLIMTVVLRH